MLMFFKICINSQKLRQHMKKFLNLKKTIIESKNEPILFQTYLDSIRSSCYKLSNPELFANEDFVSCKDLSQIFESHGKQNTANRTMNSMDITQKITGGQLSKKFNLNKTNSWEQCSKNASRQLKNIDVWESTNNMNSQITEGCQMINRELNLDENFRKTQKIDQIFSHIQSRCSDSGQKSYSEEQMGAKILQQLSILQHSINNNQKSMKELAEPIELIRKIIFANMKVKQVEQTSQKTINKAPKNSKIKTETLSPNLSAITQNKARVTRQLDLSLTSNEFQELSLQKNKFTSIKPEQFDGEDDQLFPLKIKFVKKKKISSNNKKSQQNNQSYTKSSLSKTQHLNVAQQQHLQGYNSYIEGKSEEFLEALSQNNSVLSSQSNRYCTIKYQKFMPHEQISDQYQKIEEKEKSENIVLTNNFNHSQEEEEEDLASNNTMLSQDLNQWSNDKLYRISQKQEEESEESTSKKYSIASKKSQNAGGMEDDLVESQFNNKNFQKYLKEAEESIQFKKIRYMLESGSTNKKDKLMLKDILKQSMQINTNNLTEQNKLTKNSQVHKRNLFAEEIIDKQNRIPFGKVCLQKASVLNQNIDKSRLKTLQKDDKQKQDKEKTIKDIVNMLNTKYNRNFAFKK